MILLVQKTTYVYHSFGQSSSQKGYGWGYMYLYFLTLFYLYTRGGKLPILPDAQFGWEFTYSHLTYTSVYFVDYSIITITYCGDGRRITG